LKKVLLTEVMPNNDDNAEFIPLLGEHS
jgi:hypothetical protein